MSRSIIALSASLLLCVPVVAEELLLPIPLEVAGETARFEAKQGQPRQVVAEVAEPRVSRPVYAVKGLIRYDQVGGDAYLQLDSDFGEHGRFFTKSLEEQGPLGKITGSSEWRPFALPFYAGSGDGPAAEFMTPESLTLSVNLDGPGAIYLRDVALYQYGPGENPLTGASAWFDGRRAGLVGGIGGALLGLGGAVVGMLAGRGRGRVFVLGSSAVLFGAGAAALVAGLLALFFGQPYAVYYTFLWMGGLLVIVIGGLRRVVARRYADIELKKMEAMDA